MCLKEIPVNDNGSIPRRSKPTHKPIRRTMDIDSLEEFIRMQKESLAREKHEFGLDLEHTPNPNTLSTEFSDLPKSDDHLVPSLLVETACNMPDNDSTSEQQQMHNKVRILIDPLLIALYTD